MNKNDIIRHRLDQGLSGVTVSLQHRIKLMDEIFGGKKVKRKLTYGLILAIVLMLLTVSALAVIVWNQVFERVITKEAESGIIASWTTKERIDLLVLLAENGWEFPDKELDKLTEPTTSEKDKDRISAELITEHLGRIDAVSHMDIIEQVKGPMIGWSLEDKAWYNNYMRSHGLLRDSWHDVLPDESDISREQIIKIARNRIIAAYKLEENALDDYLVDISFFTYDLKDEPRWKVDFRLNESETAAYSVLLTRQGEVTADEHMEIYLPEHVATQSEAEMLDEKTLLERVKGPSETWSLEDKAKYLGSDNGLPAPGEISEEEAVLIASNALKESVDKDLSNHTISVWYKLFDYYADSDSPQSPFYLIFFIDSIEEPYDVFSVLIDPKTGVILDIHGPGVDKNHG